METSRPKRGKTASSWQENSGNRQEMEGGLEGKGKRRRGRRKKGEDARKQPCWKENSTLSGGGGRLGSRNGEGDRDGGGNNNFGGGEANQPEGLNIIYTNTRSILSKLQDIEVLSDQEKPDLILLTETWCNDRVSNCNLNICNYELIKELRRDRTDTRDGIGGGLLVYAKKGLQILSHDNQIDFNQYVHFSLKTFDSPVNIFLVYKPPSSNVNNQEKLCDLINSIPKNSVLIGDFNYPNIDWENNTADSNISRKFMETCLENNLTQYVDFPTHIRNNILDLVLANDNCVLSVSDLGHLGNSDHNVLKIITKHNLEPSEDSIKIKD